MPRLFNNYESEILNLQAWRQRQDRVRSIADAVTPDQAARIAQYGRHFPTLDPGLVRSLAQAGVAPTSPVAQFAITQADYRNMMERGSWDRDTRRRRVAPQPLTTDEQGWDIRGRAVMQAAEKAGIVQDGMLVEPPKTGATDEQLHAFSRVQKLFTDLNRPLPFLSNTGHLVEFTSSKPENTSDPYRKEGTGYVRYLNDTPTPGDPGGLAGFLKGFTEMGDVQAGYLGLPTSSQGGLITGAAESFANLAERTSAPLQQAGIVPKTPPVRSQMRSMFAAFDAPVQELQGQVRNVYSATHGGTPDWGLGQSDLAVMLNGNYGVDDAGKGVFVDPESAVAVERRKREATRGQINGHNITLGRWIADAVAEPDTTPYRIMSGLVDAGVQVADPTAFVMGKAGELRTASRTFQVADESAGLFSGVRRYFDGPTAQHWLDNNIGTINRLAAEDDPYAIARLTNFKLEPSLVRALADTPDTRQVRSLITEAIEHGSIRETTDITGTIPTRIRRSWQDTIRELNPSYTPRATRLFQTMPGQVLDLNNPRQYARDLMNVLHNANADPEVVRTAYNMVARSQTRNGLFSALEYAQGQVGGMLERYGLKNEELINRLVRLPRETVNKHLQGLVDDIGQDVPTWEHVLADGSSEWTPGAHLPSEHLGRFVHLPDQRAIRRLTSRYKFLTARSTEEAIGKPRLPLALMDSFTSQLLKPLWLLRLAWPIRQVGEEQIRMAAAGLDSAFSSHPISWMAYAIGTKESRLSKILEALPGIKGSSKLTASGLLFEDLEEFRSGVYNTHRAWLDRPGSVAIPHKTLFDRNIEAERPDFIRAWADELGVLSKDPVSNYVANHTLDDAYDWFVNGQGRKHHTALSEAHPGNLGDELSTRRYLQTVSDRIRWMTGGDTDLLEAVKTGSLRDASMTAGGVGRLNPAFKRYLHFYLDAAPRKIKGDIWSRKGLRGEMGGAWREFTDRMFGALMGTPTARLSRSPAFKQFYWNRVAELLPFSDEATRSTVLLNAEKSGLNSRTMRTLNRAAKRGTGQVSIEELEDLAKGYALDDTKGLLYDISEKGQISDVLRNVAPFAEAWREILRTWSKLVLDTGGKPVRRAQQALQGARGEEFGDVMGAPEDKGFFYKNEFGEEVFAYPGSQWLMNQEFGIPGTPFQLPGMPVPLTGRVQGLNMFGSILPSLGPVAMVPVAYFLQDKPQYDWLKQQLMPFGGPGAEEASTIFDLEQYLPSYMKTAINWFTEGGKDDRVFNSTVMYVAAYLSSTGEYSNTIEDQQRLMEDARGRARDIYAIRALGQFMLPSSPTPDWMVKDQSGRLLSTRILAEEFFDTVEKSKDYEQAVGIFLERYGTEAVGAIIPHSANIIPNVPTSLEAAQWVADHPGIKSSFPLTYAYFAPEGKFHYETYVRNFISNERDALTIDQWVALRDNTLANYWYNYEKRRLGPDAVSPNDDQQRWLRGRREEIQKIYPQWGNNTGRAERPELDVLVRDLYRAAEDPLLSSTSAGKALNIYLQSRNEAVEYSRSWSDTGSPNSFRTAQAFSSTRESLRRIGNELVTRYPEFEPMWISVFDRELQGEEG